MADASIVGVKLAELRLRRPLCMEPARAIARSSRRAH
jgi:hypothetical protein